MSVRCAVRSAIGLSALAACLAIIAIWVSAARDSDAKLSHGAFVWQLRWTPRVTDAIRHSRDVMQGFYILAGEIDPDESVRLAQIPLSQMQDAAGGKAIEPVVRIDAAFNPSGRDRLVASVMSVLDRFPAPARARIMVDADVPVSHLADYAAFLDQLRQRLPPGAVIDATALPAWVAGADFNAVERAADRLVLQVHSLDDPRLGVFDAARAERQLTKFAQSANKPFALALPAYGLRVSLLAPGVPLMAEGETARMIGPAGQEVIADPAAVAAFLGRLSARHPVLLREVIWFRLPVAGDRRAWGEATLRAVIAGTYHPPVRRLVTKSAQSPGVRDIFIENGNDIDTIIPKTIRLPKDCLYADAVPPYRLSGDRLVTRDTLLLPAGAAVRAGWTRCDGELRAE